LIKPDPYSRNNNIVFGLGGREVVADGNKEGPQGWTQGAAALEDKGGRLESRTCST
jgi:hypothetical protein